MNAIDEDFGEYGMLTYDIFSDEMKEYFSIDKTKGEIVTKIKLDREEQKMYEVPVIATDGGGRSGFTMVKIRVGDQNDKTPQFYLREYKTSIYGNLSVNATFLNVSATLFPEYYCFFFPRLFLFRCSCGCRCCYLLLVSACVRVLG